MWTELQAYWLTGFPVFSAHAWPLDWNIPRTIGEGWIDAYYFDPNNGRWRPPYYDFSNHDYFPWFNLAFTYNTSTDYWLKRMWLSNYTDKAIWMNKIADFAQNYQYNWIFVSQGMQGSVIWKDWELNLWWPGTINYHRLSYVGFPSDFPEIPGFLFYIVIFSSVLTLVGIIYSMRRKTRFI